MPELNVPRLLISAPTSGSGKTTIVCALLQALLNRGLHVAAFKSGPDYIDPMFHSRVIGAKSRNLDVFMLGRQVVRYLCAKNAQDADVAIFEGAMGYYDGVGQTSEASAYDLAVTCRTPVVLIVNARGAALSLGALINGFKNFRSDSRIVGAVLNNVNPMTYNFYREVIEQETGVRLLGYFPVQENCGFASRHLGLVTAAEISDLQAIVTRLAEQAAASLDLDGLLAVARTAEPLAYEDLRVRAIGKARIAVAMDKAFCFYYQDALDLLQELGAELCYFSPISDRVLPPCDGLILGGGYPELVAAELAANRSMCDDIKEKVASGLPCYAECGGFMYLMERYRDGTQAYNWVGAIPGEVALTKKLTRFGYVRLTAQQDSVLAPAGASINGHEFHYSDSQNNGEAFLAEKASGRASWRCGHVTPTLYAAYPHLHFWGNRHFAENFFRKCCAYARRQENF